MAEIEIHGHKVKIDENSHSAKYGAHYLSKLRPDEAKAFFDEAKRDVTNHAAHFETPHDNEHHDVDHHLTLVHESDGSYHLRKKSIF